MTSLPLDTTCPFCGRRNDLVAALVEGTTPEPGALSLCFTCGQAAVFGEGLALRAPVEGDLSPADREVIARVQAIWRASRPEQNN